jgi:hypothetical protein
MYSDNKTGHTYLAFAYNEVNEINIDSYLCIIDYPINEAVPKKECRKQSREVTDVSLSGFGDGANLFIVYSARRKMRLYECNNESTGGCFDLYYLETTDGGKTWSLPKQIAHSNLTDAYQRTGPVILGIPENKSTSLIFTRKFNDNANFSVMLSKRVQGNPQFTYEQFMGNWTSRISDVSFKYSLAKSASVVLHLLFQKDNANLSRFMSVNNGFNWTETIIRNDSSTYLYSMSGCWERDQIYIASYVPHKPYQIDYLETTPDGILSWDSFIPNFNGFNQYFEPVISDLPGVSHAALFTAVPKTDAVVTFIFTSENEGLRDMEPAPVAGFRIAAYNHTGGAKVRLIHSVSNAAYMSSYKFVDSQLKYSVQK